MPDPVQWQDALTPESTTLLGAHNVPSAGDKKEHTRLRAALRQPQSSGGHRHDVKPHRCTPKPISWNPQEDSMIKM